MTARSLGVLLASLALLSGCSLSPVFEAPRTFAEKRAALERLSTEELRALAQKAVDAPLLFSESCPLPENLSREDLLFFAGPPVPAIDAQVTAVREGEPGLVRLSAGSGDKVEKGFSFAVYRGIELVGRVIVETVHPDSSNCRVVFTKKDASIRPGDFAATRLQ